MAPYEMRMAARHDCPFCELSSRYPHLTFRAWDNFRSVIIEVTGLTRDEASVIMDEPVFMGDTQVIQEGNRTLRMIVRDYVMAEDAISQIINENDCWYLQPNEMREGWEHFRVYSYSRNNLQLLVGAIESIGGESRIESIHPMEVGGLWEPLLPASSILAGLTSKQLNAISEALAMGYFEEPSRVNAVELARKLGVSRSTFSEHLRKAERKILINIFSSIRSQDME